MDKTKFISIAGNIAVGKTTLTTMIAERFGWRPYYESVDDNPYLSDFYGDMKKWSFHLQVYFLSKRFLIQQTMVQGDRPAVQDRTIYEDADIFARSLYDLGNMSERDWENYKSLFETMVSYLQKPALIIYLRATTETLIKRLAQRGRNFEKTITSEYLRYLNERYEKWVEQISGTQNVLIIDTNGLNVFSDISKVNQLMDQIIMKAGIEK